MRFFTKTIQVASKFSGFKFVARGSKNVLKLAKRHKVLNKALKTIFNKKTALVAGVSGAVAIGAQYVNQYIHDNSGCFLYDRGVLQCKMKDLSCCQTGETDVAFCDPFPTVHASICDGYDTERETSCCRLCDCQHYDCSPSQELKCRNPTVGEALSFFAKSGTKSLLSTVFDSIPYLKPILFGIVGVVVLFLLITFLR